MADGATAVSPAGALLARHADTVRQLGWVLAGFGLLLGGLAAVAWHWQPAFGWFAYTPLADVDTNAGGFWPVMEFRQLVWPVAVGFPLVGAALGIAAAWLLARRFELVARRRDPA